MDNQYFLTSIITILGEHEQLSAKQIAKDLFPELSSTDGKREVNRILYTYENTLWRKNESNEWYLIKRNLNSKNISNFQGIKNDQKTFIQSLVIALLRHSNLDLFGLAERDIDVLERIVINGESYAEIAHHYSLTSERIRQIYTKSLEKLVDGLIQLISSFNDAKVQIENLERDYTALLNENAVYQQAIRNAIKQVDLEENSKAKMNENKILNQPLTELDLSVRASNCLRRARIFTIGDLMKYSIKELLAIQNFGRQTLEEVQIELKSLNLFLK
jgi:hypothetical protein